MTDKQKLARLTLRHDFMEDWLARMLSLSAGSEHEARWVVRKECELVLKEKGFKYPFRSDDN